jgi:hypothetical protein
MDRYRLVRLADLDGNSVVLEEQPDLLGEVAAKEIGSGNRRLMRARP